MRKIIALAIGLSLSGCASLQTLDAKYGYHGSMKYPCLGRGLDCNPEAERARMLAGQRQEAVQATDIFKPDYRAEGPVGVKF